MARSLWKGFVSFGLVAIPVSIVPVEEKHDIRFHLLDVRDKSRIRYQRVNSETGKEVTWGNIVKGYEIDKDRYVVMNDEDFQKARPEAYKSIDINEFVDLKDIDNLYFDKPYYLKQWIEKKSKTHVSALAKQKISPKKDDVIDFVTLLKKSMEKKESNKADTRKRVVKAKKLKSR